MSKRSDFTTIDAIIYAAILVFGGMQFLCYLRVTDFVNDSTYFELARSIIDKHSYELFSFRPETMLPPGFPVILTLVLLFAGGTISAFYHVIAIAATVGLMAAYALLRRTAGRAVAAFSILLLASSPALFEFTTRVVFSDMPYFALSMIVLLLAWKLTHGRPSILGMLFLSLVLAVLLLVRSSGLAMIMALAVWMAASWLWDADNRHRLKLFLVPLIVGCFVQLAWTDWAGHRQFSEWPVPGYPGSYLSQLELKSGNDPELGMARLRDIPVRVIDNLSDRASQFVRVMTRANGIEAKWCSPAVAGVLLLVCIGLASSLRRRGGQLHDWYFLFYEAIFAMWPWEFELRFLLPIIPLICLYLWRGGNTVVRSSIRKPKLAGSCLCLAGLLLAGNCAVWLVREQSLQSAVATTLWTILAITGGAIAASALKERHRIRITRAGRSVAAVAVCALIAIGCRMQMSIARMNGHFHITEARYYPDIEAAQWIHVHEPPQSIVMARKEDLVYHYSHHPVVWFPPISNPDVLMRGIEKYHVSTVVVVDRKEEYFMPTQSICFQHLLATFSHEFHMVHHGPGDWIFEINSVAPAQSHFANTATRAAAR